MAIAAELYNKPMIRGWKETSFAFVCLFYVSLRLPFSPSFFYWRFHEGGTQVEHECRAEWRSMLKVIILNSNPTTWQVQPKPPCTLTAGTLSARLLSNTLHWSALCSKNCPTEAERHPCMFVLLLHHTTRHKWVHQTCKIKCAESTGEAAGPECQTIQDQNK